MALWHRHSGVAYAAVLTGVCGHASTEFFAVLSGVAGPELSVWRFVLGGLGLVLLASLFPASRDLLAPLKLEFWRIVGLSLLSVTVSYLLFHWSLDFATVPQVATAVTTIPIFVALTDAVVNRRRIGRAKALSGLCAILGIVLLLVGLAFGTWARPARLAELPAVGLGAVLVIALWNTTITQFLWIGGLAAVPDITRGSYLFFLKPVIAALLAVLVLGQGITVVQMLAIAVVCASVAGELLLGRRNGVP